MIQRFIPYFVEFVMILILQVLLVLGTGTRRGTNSYSYSYEYCCRRVRWHGFSTWYSKVGTYSYSSSYQYLLWATIATSNLRNNIYFKSYTHTCFVGG